VKIVQNGRQRNVDDAEIELQHELGKAGERNDCPLAGTRHVAGRNIIDHTFCA
jgi:hypothetical protein